MKVQPRPVEVAPVSKPRSEALETKVLRQLNLDAPTGPGRGAYVSAASGLVQVGRYLYVAADDELHLAVFPRGGGPGRMVRALPGSLPADDEARKSTKPDFEALTALPPSPAFPHGALLALGSGSSEKRHRGVFWALGPDGALEGQAREVDLQPLHEALDKKLPEVNIEGAVAVQGRLRLLQRANEGQLGAVVDLDLAGVLERLERGKPLDGALVKAIRTVDLGEVDGVRLGFSDAAPLPDGRIVFTAVAEDTDDAVADGAFVGGAVGILELDGTVSHLRAVRGHKIEGVHAEVEGQDVRLLFVADADDARFASPLLSARLTGVMAAARRRHGAARFEPSTRPSVSLSGEAAHHALPPEVLKQTLEKASASVAALKAEPMPQTRQELVETYARLGLAVAEAEAALIGTLDALDRRPDKTAPSPYQKLRDWAFQALREAGEVFAKLDPAWGQLVHGSGGWPSRPVQLWPDRGDGRPFIVYENTFRRAEALSSEQKKAEYDSRANRFVERGGRFEDIIVAHKGVFEGLERMLRYDYVVEHGGPMRLFPNGDDNDAAGPPKPGHSLLLVGGRTFRDVRALMAGELWVMKDSRGDLEAVVVANNSGHFKPRFEDLSNVLPVLEKLGVPREKIVLFGGPNNLVAMFRELSEKFPDEMKDLSGRLPPPSSELLKRMYEAAAVPTKPVWS